MSEREEWVRVESESELAPGMAVKTVDCGGCQGGSHTEIIVNILGFGTAYGGAPFSGFAP